MTKWLSKWLRKFHRWIANANCISNSNSLIIKLIGDPKLLAKWEELDKIPSVLMLIMALSGAYLFLLPYIVKGQRKKKIPANKE